MTFIEFIKKIFGIDIPYEEEEMLREYPRNYENFPNNIFPPETKEVSGEEYLVYRARFNSLNSLYNYLKSDPELNRVVFHELSSITGSKSFAGKPYDEAVEDLISYENPDYFEFLRFQNEFNNAVKGEVHKFQTVRTVAGGHLNVPAYCAGDPLCYETEEKIVKPLFMKLNVTLSYPAFTERSQVINRAIIIASLVRALEKAGYSVDLDAFELSEEYREICYIAVGIKEHGDTMNMLALYKSMCNTEFLRRILFRILETFSVEEGWGHGYGRTCSAGFVKSFLNLGKDELYFDTPSAMGIRGKDLAEDFESSVRHLGLEDTIDLESSLDGIKRIRKKQGR